MRYTIVVVLAVLLFAAGCGSDKKAAELKAKQETAVTAALADYQQFRQASTGMQAESLRAKIKSDLAGAGLTFSAISVTEAELQAKQDELYNSEAVALSKKLHNTHGNAQQARELANEVRRLKDKAGQPVSPDLEKGLELAVARNMQEEAAAIKKAHGVSQPKVVARRQQKKAVRTARR